jgi:hypothetical protein
MSHFDEDDPAGETRIDGNPTPLDALPPSAFGGAPGRRAPPPVPPPRPKFAAPPPSEAPRFEQPIHQAKPIDRRPVTYFDAPVTEPPRSMVMALGISLLMAFVMAITGTPEMLLVPGCAPSQVVFAVLVAVTCWRGRGYGRPFAVLGALLWMFAGALAIRGHSNMITTLSHESWTRGDMPEVTRLFIVVRAAWEAFLVWTLFRPDATKYFAHRASVDKLGGRKWS